MDTQHARKGLPYLLSAAQSQVQKRGLFPLLGDVWTLGSGYLRHRVLRKGTTFVLDGRTYPTLRHTYNVTWDTEHAVEIPLAWSYVRQYAGQRVLEVGNVLSHYHPIEHDIVDKYEQLPGIINVDVVDFDPDYRYDLIVSISTLEHVGWDEVPRDPLKVGRALAHLRGLLAPGGLLLVTIPVGYNPHLDIQFAEGMIPLDETYFMKRISHDADWVEVQRAEVQGLRFGIPFRCANGLIIGMTRAPRIESA